MVIFYIKKSTKKHYTWEFNINEVHHKIEIYDSKISNKKKLICDGKTITQKYNENDFSYCFDIGKNSITIVKMGDGFELRINNRIFSYLLELEKNKIFFNKKKTQPISNISITKPNYEKINNKTYNFGVGVLNEIDKEKNNASLFNFSIKEKKNNLDEYKNYEDINNNSFPAPKEEFDYFNNFKNKENFNLLDLNDERNNDNKDSNYGNIYINKNINSQEKDKEIFNDNLDPYKIIDSFKNQHIIETNNKNVNISSKNNELNCNNNQLSINLFNNKSNI